MFYLGIDSGTQSTKSIVLDLETGAIVAQSSQAYGLIDGLPSGHLEQHPSDWIDAVKATISDCLNQLGERKSSLRGIGVSGQQHGLVVLDANDEVIRPAKLWCDTSTIDQCDQFSAEFGGTEGLIAKAGNAILPGYTIPKLLWLKQNEPENFAKTKSVLLPHDYINFFLTGVKRMEFGDASGMGILNIREKAWETDLIDFVDPSVREMLPELGSSNVVHGTLRSELASEWGLSDEVIISAGGGDNMMGAIGTGNIADGVITASFGTSGTLYGCAENPVIDPNGEIAAFCDSTDRWMPLACTMNVTVVTEQVRSWFGWDLAELERQVDSVAPGVDGVSFLPYLNGERTPNLPNGTGVIHGLGGSSSSPAHLARAAMEGATLGLAYGLRRFAALGLTPGEIRLTGGGSKSAVWRQISADVFGVPVVGLTTSEGAGLGGAIQAAHADGKGSYEDLCARLVTLNESTRCEPNAENAGIYTDKLDRQIKLTEVLKEAGML
ncbi:MAG: xylulokinase [Verrucomicrobiales bacterium]|jgi:xylulokinase|nr:xylulokinase [Verrucomicrobiales bacterium]